MSFDFIDRKHIVRPLAEDEPKPEPEPCANCDGGGWECYGLGWGDPHFRPCSKCGNPDDLPSS